MKDKPEFVKRGAIVSGSDYVQWLADVKQRFRFSQAKAAVRVNNELLSFYWSLGRDIVRMKADAKWGSSFFENLSLDLRKEFPDQKGFSVSNLKYIKRWFEFYFEQDIIRHQVGDEFGKDEQGAIRQRSVDELEDEEMPSQFALIPWRQHIEDHYRQHRFVVVELKVVDFEPEFAGKLNFYVSAADELLRGEGDKPSVGLLICKTKDEATVEWSLRGIETPLGVANYELENVIRQTISQRSQYGTIQKGSEHEN